MTSHETQDLCHVFIGCQREGSARYEKNLIGGGATSCVGGD